MLHLEYMAAAYALVWGVILAYFISLGRREKQIWEEIEDLRSRLRTNEAASDPNRG